MKLSPILGGAMAAIVAAGPLAIHKEERAATPVLPANLLDIFLQKLNVPNVPQNDLGDLAQCLRVHKTFQTDYTNAVQGEMSISHLDQTCYEKAKAIWEETDDQRLGHAHFNNPCNGVAISGVSRKHLNMVRLFLASV